MLEFQDKILKGIIVLKQKRGSLLLLWNVIVRSGSNLVVIISIYLFMATKTRNG